MSRNPTMLLMLMLPAAVAATEPATPQWLAGAARKDAGAGIVLAQSWASWCHSCAGLAPALAKLVRERPGVRLEAISVDASAQEARPAAGRLAAAAGGLASVAWGGPDYARRWSLETVPTVRVLADGRELVRVEGHPNASDLARLAAALDEALVGARP